MVHQIYWSLSFQNMFSLRKTRLKWLWSSDLESIFLDSNVFRKIYQSIFDEQIYIFCRIEVLNKFLNNLDHQNKTMHKPENRLTSRCSREFNSFILMTSIKKNAKNKAQILHKVLRGGFIRFEFWKTFHSNDEREIRKKWEYNNWKENLLETVHKKKWLGLKPQTNTSQFEDFYYSSI